VLGVTDFEKGAGVKDYNGLEQEFRSEYKTKRDYIDKGKLLRD